MGFPLSPPAKFMAVFLRLCKLLWKSANYRYTALQFSAEFIDLPLRYCGHPSRSGPHCSCVTSFEILHHCTSARERRCTRSKNAHAHKGRTRTYWLTARGGPYFPPLASLQKQYNHGAYLLFQSQTNRRAFQIAAIKREIRGCIT